MPVVVFDPGEVSVIVPVFLFVNASFLGEDVGVGEGVVLLSLFITSVRVGFTPNVPLVLPLNVGVGVGRLAQQPTSKPVQAASLKATFAVLRPGQSESFLQVPVQVMFSLVKLQRSPCSAACEGVVVTFWRWPRI